MHVLNVSSETEKIGNSILVCARNMKLFLLFKYETEIEIDLPLGVTELVAEENCGKFYCKQKKFWNCAGQIWTVSQLINNRKVSWELWTWSNSKILKKIRSNCFLNKRKLQKFIQNQLKICISNNWQMNCQLFKKPFKLYSTKFENRSKVSKLPFELKFLFFVLKQLLNSKNKF